MDIVTEPPSQLSLPPETYSQSCHHTDHIPIRGRPPTGHRAPTHPPLPYTYHGHPSPPLTARHHPHPDYPHAVGSSQDSSNDTRQNAYFPPPFRVADNATHRPDPTEASHRHQSDIQQRYHPSPRDHSAPLPLLEPDENQHHLPRAASSAFVLSQPPPAPATRPSFASMYTQQFTPLPSQHQPLANSHSTFSTSHATEFASSQQPPVYRSLLSSSSQPEASQSPSTSSGKDKLNPKAGWKDPRESVGGVVYPSLIRKRRRRTTPAELAVLEAHFAKNALPCHEEREAIAAKLSM